MQYPKPPYPDQKQSPPGETRKMDPVPDHGEESYRGTGRLKGKRAIITGGDSGIGRAVAIAYAREGVDILISYLNEDEDAAATAALVEAATNAVSMATSDQIRLTRYRLPFSRDDPGLRQADSTIRVLAKVLLQRLISALPVRTEIGISC